MRTADRSLEIARLVDRLRATDPKVVAFDLAGAETGFPPSMHAEALRSPGSATSTSRCTPASRRTWS